jgi:hypothetical protein
MHNTVCGSSAPATRRIGKLKKNFTILLGLLICDQKNRNSLPEKISFTKIKSLEYFKKL